MLSFFRSTLSDLKPHVVLLAILGASSALAADWTTHARRFTGESARVRQEAIQALRKDPKLEQKLTRALGTHDHFLALDVISVLKLRSFLPILTKFSRKDRTGYSYHVLNSLMLAEEIPELSRLYLERLRSDKSSPAAKLALLDSLGRMQVELSNEDLRSLLNHEEPEIRSAALYYLRAMFLRANKYEAFPLLEAAIKDPVYQNRVQALYLLAELPRTAPAPVKTSLARFLQLCADDPVGEVKSLCQQLRSRRTP